MKSQEFRIVRVDELKLDQVLRFTSVYFSPSESMLSYLKITPEIFSQTFDPILKACYSSGFSFVALSSTSSEIAAILFSAPYLKFGQAFSQIQPSSIREQILPVVTLLGELESTYKPKNEHKTISHFIGITNPKYKGNHLISKLNIHIQSHALKQGYNQFLSDCTSSTSKKITLHNGYIQKNRIYYNTFQFKGRTPFKGLPGSEGVFLMSKVVRLGNL